MSYILFFVGGLAVVVIIIAACREFERLDDWGWATAFALAAAAFMLGWDGLGVLEGVRTYGDDLWERSGFEVCVAFGAAVTWILFLAWGRFWRRLRRWF